MTGGVVVILGDVGRNLCAGMSGGTLYLYDPTASVHHHLSGGVYEVDPLESADDVRLRQLLERYLLETESQRVRELLSNWRCERMNFVKVETSEYQRVREKMTSG
jgi:glutamate synthase (NADPH/NADH) large chain